METLVKSLAPMLLNTGIMAVYIVVMVRQSPVLAAIGLLSLLLNITVATLTSHRRMDIARIQMRDRGKMEATAVTGIDMIETIKSSGFEQAFFQRWANYQASVTETTVRAARTDVLLGSLPMFLNAVINYAVLILGVMLTMQGRFTLGAILLFQSLLGAFLKPAMQLVSANQTISEMRTQMERIDDVMEYPADPNTAEDRELPLDEANKLRRVELKDVSFGYSALEKPLIENLSLSVEPGKRIALVGASGCGKSTISKLISGLYQPWSGEILFDGKPRQAWPREVLVGSLAVVDQDIILFEDTIENNIKMWDTSIQDFEMILAARDAQIHNDIMELPGGYKFKLISGGRNLSGGQRQQLEIARVLAQDPTIIILDEATSALDARTEFETVKAITDRGIACVVIAHRLSTIRDCDEIIVLDHGKVVERGTHAELMAQGGAYSKLVFCS